jgi:hypothetical protein
MRRVFSKQQFLYFFIQRINILYAFPGSVSQPALIGIFRIDAANQTP